MGKNSQKWTPKLSRLLPGASLHAFLLDCCSILLACAVGKGRHKDEHKMCMSSKDRVYNMNKWMKKRNKQNFKKFAWSEMLSQGMVYVLFKNNLIRDNLKGLLL